MQKFLLTVLLYISAVNSFATSFLSTNNEDVRLKYYSVDANNNPILLSEMVSFPKGGPFNTSYATVKFVVLNNHPTTTLDEIVPTGKEPQIDQIRMMTGENAMTVSPDYLGYGQSVDITHPYMCHTLTARNVVDGLMAAFAEAKKRGIMFDANYYTDNIGYSQGGGVTLAVQKFLENEASEEVKKTVRLRKSFVGAGAMQMSEVFEEYESQASMNYPALLPYMMMGLFYTYGSTGLRGLDMYDLFTESFKQMDVFDRLQKKNTVVADINSMIINKYGGKCNFYDIMSPVFKDKSSPAYRQIYKVIKKNDLLDGSWIPQHPITFFHYEKDEVVPYSQSIKAVNLFKSLGCKDIEMISATDDYKDLIEDWSWRDLALTVKKPDLTHMGYGTVFYIAYFSESMR